MSRQIALLRGINVGKAKRVAMADLRRLLEGFGYEEVATLLNSGNAVFTVPAGSKGEPGARIQKGLGEELGVTCQVQVIPATALARVVRNNPLVEVATDDSRLMITFLAKAADGPRLKALAKHDWGDEVLALAPGVAYQWCPEGLMESKLAAAVGKALGAAATTRNWATVQKLHVLAAGASPTREQ